MIHKGPIETTVYSIPNPERFEGPMHRDSVMALGQATVDSTILYKDAHTDHMTGLGNRRALLESIEDMSQETKDFALLFIDVDNFKRLNDTLGHGIGDKYLTLLAEGLKNLKLREGEGFYHIDGKETQESDEDVFRIGGDEIVILIKTKNTKNGKRNLDMTPQEIIDGVIGRAHTVADSVGKELEVPKGVGISAAAVQFIQGEDALSLIHRGDTAMYEVKNATRAAQAGLVTQDPL